MSPRQLAEQIRAGLEVAAPVQYFPPSYKACPTRESKYCGEPVEHIDRRGEQDLLAWRSEKIHRNEGGLLLEDAQDLPSTSPSPVSAPAPVKTQDLAKPQAQDNLALIAIIAPVLLLMIGAGIWWWSKYRKENKRYGPRSAKLSAALTSSGRMQENPNTARLPRIETEVPMQPDEHELRRQGKDIGGRWGPSFRWWWIRRARARGELSTTVADNGSVRSLSVVGDGDDDLEMNKISRNTTMAGSSKASSSRREASVAVTGTEQRSAKTRSTPVSSMPQQRAMSRESSLSSLSSLESRPEPVRDVLWWEGVDHSDED